MKCPHGVNLNHKSCSSCEEVARAEMSAHTRVTRQRREEAGGEVSIFDLNPNRLDQEWLSQPRHYHKYATELADARERYERAKSNRDVVAAEVAMDVRSRPDAYGFDGPKGPTVDAVKEAVIINSRYRKADAELIKAKHDLDIADAVVSALDHRKKALEKLVELRLADYFSEPRAPKGSERLTGDRSFGSGKRR